MKVFVVGGGAAGMVAALIASYNGHEVTILEHKDRLGKKILATGNGRCNLSNSLLRDNPGQYYRCLASSDNGTCFETVDFINALYDEFSYDDTISFFNKLGLCTKAKGTLIYPYSDQAGSVLDVLRFAIRDCNIKVITNCDVYGIKKQSDGAFLISSKITEEDNDSKNKKAATYDTEYVADRVILATGSKAQSKLGADGSGYRLLGKMGHKITHVSPALVQMVAHKEGKQDIFKTLAGVRIHAVIQLLIDDKPVAKEDGELQLTAYGISGIAVMNLTTFLNQSSKNIRVNVDLAPEYSEETILEQLNNKRSQYPDRLSEELLIGFLPKKLGDVFLKLSNIGCGTEFSKISDNSIVKLAKLIKKWTIDIDGTNTFDDAQICMGGLPIIELKPTLESRKVPGLYIAGEIIDAHGPCGGFNLQQAWSSGAVAGRLG